MKKAIAMADNCIDVYYRMDRYYLTGNSIDFALNYKAQGGDVTEMTVLGNDVFADALVERLKQRDIPLRVLKRIDRPTGMAKMEPRRRGQKASGISRQRHGGDRAFRGGYGICQGL